MSLNPARSRSRSRSRDPISSFLEDLGQLDEHGHDPIESFLTTAMGIIAKELQSVADIENGGRFGGRAYGR